MGATVETPKFSVILLTYNSDDDSIKMTIDSILKQKDCHYEIIIADDASQNDCVKFAKSYLEECKVKDYKFLGHEENVGTVRNIYDALQKAAGRYVKCIGAGDMLFDEYVLNKVYTFMRFRKPTMCFGKMKGYTLDEGRLSFTDICLPYDIEAFVSEDIKRIRRNIIVNHGWIVGADMFYDRERFSKLLKVLVGRVRYCEDFLQLILLLYGDEILFIDEPVVYYEMANGISTNTASQATSRMMEDVKAFSKLLMDKYSKNYYVRQGDRMFTWQKIENTRLRQIKIFLGNQNYVHMLLKSRKQRDLYAITEKGFLERSEEFSE